METWGPVEHTKLSSFDDIVEFLENLFYMVLYHGNRALGSPVLCCIYAVQVDESSTE